MSQRHYTRLDRVLMALDASLRAQSSISTPAEPQLSASERQRSIASLRVNHCGEVCAQALYLGQALLARDPQIAQHLLTAAQEELEHLHWCRTRLQQLGGNCSRLNGLFATQAFLIGLGCALISDRVSLSFLVETERQVAAHLQKHLTQVLPVNDYLSQDILRRMQADEVQHADTALALGGRPLSGPWRFLMRQMARLMTSSTFYL